MSAGYKSIVLHKPNAKVPDSFFHPQPDNQGYLPFNSQIGSDIAVFGISLLLTKSLATSSLVTGAYWLAQTFKSGYISTVPVR